MTIKNNLVSFLTAAVVVVSAAVAVPQGMEGIIRGTVTDEDGGAPLPDTVITLDDPSSGKIYSTKTDKKGAFYKRGIIGSAYRVSVRKEGYKLLEEPLRVAAGAEHKFNFKLAKAAPVGAKEFAEGFQAFNRGDNAAAAQFFELAMQKAPDLPEIRVNLALAYLRLGRKADAVAKLEDAVKMAPDEPRILFQLGGAYVEMREFEKATGAFEQGLAKQPDLKDQLALEATITLGAVHFVKGDLDKSIASFEKALAAKPDNPIPMLGLGKSYLSKGDTDKALQLFQQVVAAAPGTSEAKQAEAFIAGLKKPGSPEARNEERSSA